MLDYSILNEKTVLVVGCGGLGGYVIQEIARMRLKKLIIIDGDVFSNSNMNRQLLSGYDTLGKNKAKIYASFIQEKLGKSVEYYTKFLTEENIEILNGCDIVIDCLDNVKSRKLLFSECSKRNIDLVHGAIEGEDGQVMLCSPNSKQFERLLNASEEVNNHDTVSFAVSMVASTQVDVACKALCGAASDLYDKLILIDAETLEIKKLEV